MKFVSWNVNGLKSIVNKNFYEVFKNMNADFFCIQEIKMQENQIELDLPNYYQYWNYAQKKGYSGTAIFAKEKPLNVIYGLGVEELDTEGRILTLEYDDFYLVNTYTPCYQKNIERQNFRFIWDDEFIKFISNLENKKDVIMCGDFNVAYQNIDCGNLSKDILGFSDEERQQFAKLLKLGFIDAFRYKYPNFRKYTWWKNNKREISDNGCRLDYFLIQKEFKNSIINVQIRNDIGGSDHCPIVLKLKI